MVTKPTASVVPRLMAMCIPMQSSAKVAIKSYNHAIDVKFLLRFTKNVDKKWEMCVIEMQRYVAAMDYYGKMGE